MARVRFHIYVDGDALDQAKPRDREMEQSLSRVTEWWIQAVAAAPRGLIRRLYARSLDEDRPPHVLILEALSRYLGEPAPSGSEVSGDPVQES